MNMGMVCIVTLQEASALRSTLPIARLLLDNGYDIEYVGLFSEHSISYLKLQGFNCRSFLKNTPPEGFDENAGISFKKETRRHVREVYTAQSSWIEKSFQECYEYYREFPPVLVIFERITTSWVTPFVRLGVPLVGMSITLSANFNGALPSVFSGFVPDKTKPVGNSLRIWIQWTGGYLRSIGKKIKILTRLRISYCFSKIPIVDFRTIFKQAGYKVVWGDYGFKIDVPTLFFCPKEFDFPLRQPVKNRYYAGTSVAIDRKDGDFDWEKLPSSRKNIYSTLGSQYIHCNPEARIRFYTSIINMMRSMPGYNLILQVGDRKDLKDIEVPGNVYVFDWVPHTQLFPRISLIICHAGLGTIREAVYYGVPLVVFPWAGDQHGNASRVVYHNLGKLGDFYKVTPAIIFTLVNEVLNDKEIGHSIVVFRECFEKQLDFSLGIGFFEKHMNRRGRELADIPFAAIG